MAKPQPTLTNRHLALLFVACISTTYVLGRLWQDMRLRRFLAEEAEASRRLCEESTRPWARTVRPVVTASDASRVAGEGRREEDGARGPKLLAVIGINTGLHHSERRDIVRRYWMPSGKCSSLQALESKHGVVMRFVVGHSGGKKPALDRKIEEEDAFFGDFLRLESYYNLTNKTKMFFSTALALWPNADLYIKADDDIYVNLGTLIRNLEKHRGTPRLYWGCMKTGGVVTDRRMKWFDEQHARLGDNTEWLEEYANEDVSVGSWMLGLHVQYADERGLCCSNEECGRREGVGTCMAIWDWKCTGVCHNPGAMQEIDQLTCADHFLQQFSVQQTL
eukprot:jgi/Mesvir1/28432/Mv15857-RA.1